MWYRIIGEKFLEGPFIKYNDNVGREMREGNNMEKDLK